MKIKPKKIVKVANKAPEKTTKKSNSLPPDEYYPMFEPTRFLVREAPSKKDPSKSVKQYIEVSVKRFNDDDALPYVWLQMYQESDLYTGYLKGKTVYLPLDKLYDLIDVLSDTGETCDQKGIVD